jgi:hypothetical protein
MMPRNHSRIVGEARRVNRDLNLSKSALHWVMNDYEISVPIPRWFIALRPILILASISAV